MNINQEVTSQRTGDQLHHHSQVALRVALRVVISASKARYMQVCAGVVFMLLVVLYVQDTDMSPRHQHFQGGAIYVQYSEEEMLDLKSAIWNVTYNHTPSMNEAPDGCTFIDRLRYRCDPGSRCQSLAGRCPELNISMVYLKGGGLGNLMFQYATLYATAHNYHMRAVMWEGEVLTRHFKLTTHTTNATDVGRNWTMYGLPFPATRAAENVRLAGYSQRHTDFKYYGRELRKEFTVLDHIHRDTHKLLEETLQKHGNITARLTRSTIRVGIHIRRGDFLQPHNIAFGFTTAPASYLHRSMDYFRKKFSGHVIFVVVSNDMPWATGHVSGDDVLFFHSSAINDFYLLTTCDHVIITVGSFGWWAGFLAGGEVLYYLNYPKNGSQYHKHFEPKKYYPQEWLGMGD